jgi:hypothetical protein
LPTCRKPGLSFTIIGDVPTHRRDQMIGGRQQRDAPRRFTCLFPLEHVINPFLIETSRERLVAERYETISTSSRFRLLSGRFVPSNARSVAASLPAATLFVVDY